MRLYRRKEIAGSSVVQEEKALPDAPQGRGTKLIRTSDALVDTVGKILPHVMQRKV